MANIFDFEDFQEYLRAYYEENSILHSYFSYQWLADRAGLGNKGFIYNIVNRAGTKLSVVNRLKLSEALHHSKREAEYFNFIVAYTQENDANERAGLLKKAREISDLAKVELISKDKQTFFSHWHHSVIRSLIGMIEFRGDFAQLSRKLFPPITPTEAEESVELLERLGFVMRESDGIYHLCTEKNIKTGSEYSQTDKNRYHLEFMKVTKEVLQSHPPVQSISSTMLGISEKTYEMICNELSELKERIKKLIENETEADRVFLYQTILIPLTKNSSEK